MRKRNKIASRFNIFMAIVDDPRTKVKNIAGVLGRSGRGRTQASASRQLQKMYELRISLKPQLVLKAFENRQVTTYFCKRTEDKDLTPTFCKLYYDDRINYVLYLAGCYDFFITSYDSSLNLKDYDLEIKEKSNLFDPVYTIPRGWGLTFKEAVNRFLESPFEKGIIPRDLHGILDWTELDKSIFNAMKENARRDFVSVGKEAGVFSNTVKRHFYNNVLPCCTVAHYFFPKGYDFYKKIFLKVHTDNEQSVVKALSKLPCTSYVFPVEDALLITLFHDDINIIMFMIKKMEETGIVKNYLLFVPVVAGL